MNEKQLEKQLVAASKSFLKKQVDVTRPAYRARLDAPWCRPFFIATINESEHQNLYGDTINAEVKFLYDTESIVIPEAEK